MSSKRLQARLLRVLLLTLAASARADDFDLNSFGEQ